MGYAGAAAAAALLAACMQVVSVPAGGAKGRPAASARTPAAEAREVAAQVNRHRAGMGCPPLAWDDQAARVAEAHSADMVEHGYFSHRAPDGSGPAERLARAGVAWRAVAENIAQGPAGADAAVRLWLNSRGHRANIENCVYTHQGVGVRGDRWTHVFFTPAPAR